LVGTQSNKMINFKITPIFYHNFISHITICASLLFGSGDDTDKCLFLLSAA
jgi:hypothetical protein